MKELNLLLSLCLVFGVLLFCWTGHSITWDKILISQVVYVAGVYAAILTIACTITSHFVYGKILEDDKAYSLISDNMAKGMRFNDFGNDIVKIGDLSITDTWISGMCKYHIQGVGRIKRWGKAHALVVKCFKEVSENE